jgi:NADH dehydrogenase
VGETWFPTQERSDQKAVGGVILVTGGTGFVGSHVVHELRRRDLPVRCLVRDARKGAKVAAWGCALAEGDVTDAESLRRALAGVDTVVHLVAIRQGRDEDFRRIMVDGTRYLIAASKEAGVGRFVHMSALGTSEETRELVPYYGAKWETEQMVRTAGIPHVILRPSFVFGPDGGILPTFVKLAKLTPVTPIIGSGRQRIQPIWADDLAAYVAEAVERDDVTGRLFELGGPDAVSWNEFWERLKRVLGMRRPSVHVPVGLMKVNALLTERLPGDIPLTRDLLKMLEHGDNVVLNDEAVHTFALPLLPLEDQLRRAS